MSENIDGAERRSPGPRLLVRPLLLFASVALVIGFVAIRTDVEPVGCYGPGPLRSSPVA